WRGEAPGREGVAVARGRWSSANRLSHGHGATRAGGVRAGTELCICFAAPGHLSSGAIGQGQGEERADWEATAVEGSDDAMSRELRAALHEEINRLPQEARMALVVCDLEGRSSRSAAKQLGWSVVRLERRLEQARRRLHERLARHG